MKRMDEGEVRSLYGELLACWNRRHAGDFAALFTPDGNCIGFDGSPLNGQSEIEASLREVFADHPTAAYVGKIKEVPF